MSCSRAGAFWTRSLYLAISDSIHFFSLSISFYQNTCRGRSFTCLRLLCDERRCVRNQLLEVQPKRGGAVERFRIGLLLKVETVESAKVSLELGGEFMDVLPLQLGEFRLRLFQLLCHLFQ